MAAYSATRNSTAVRVLYYAEMVVSPLLAATALLVPVATTWEAYKYIPGLVWLLVFAQCLFTFRWRGLWFLLGLPIAFLAIEAYLVAAPPAPRKELQGAVIRSDGTQTARPGVMDKAAGRSATEPPLITRNRDGTVTVQKQAPAQESGQEKGLRVPPQVIAPMNPATNKK